MSSMPVQKVLNCSFLATCFVVLNHAFVPDIDNETSILIHRIISEGLCRWAVPWFFVVSGYFLAKHCMEDGWWQAAVVKRLKTLVVPFAIWNAFALCIVGSFSLSELAIGMGLCPWEYPALNSTWYIRSLMLLIVISPVLWHYVCKDRNFWSKVVFFVASFLLVLFVGRKHMIFMISLSIEGLFYFSIGMAVRSMGGVHLSHSVRGGICISGCAAMALIMFGCLHEWGVSCVVPFLLGTVYLAIPNSRWPTLLTKASFPMYILHGIVYGTMKHFGISFARGGWLEGCYDV